MLTVQWVQKQARHRVEINISDGDGELLLEVLKLLVGTKDIGAKGILPRGREVVLYDKDAKAFGAVENTQATGLVGMPIHGDVLIISQGDYARVFPHGVH